MRTEFKKIVFVIALTLCASLTAYGDWQPSDGHKMHFPQFPDPCGWDIDLRPFQLADDWQCTKTGDVNDIHFWISWKGDVIGTIQTIEVNIYSNDPGPPSKPAAPLWSRTVYDFTIRPIDPNGLEGYWIPSGPNSQQLYYNDHTHYYQINMKNIQNPFHQVEGQIYWLSLRIPTNTPTSSRVGWKTSLNHFMDAAVAKYGTSPGWKPLYEPNSTIPIDFSFVITGGIQEANESNEPNYPTDAKWLQKPDLSSNGVDVMASANLVLADDFECNKTTKITDITIWGSWKDDYLPYGYDPNAVYFTLSIHKDIPDPDPCNASDWSMPNDVLWYRTLTPSESSIQRQDINEGWYNPNIYEYYFPGDHTCYKYTFRIDPNEAFCQQGEPCKPVVYWLDVQSHPNDTTAQFGWKTSSKHWNDDAVFIPGFEPYVGWWDELRYPSQHPLAGQSIDLAFAIEGNIPCVSEPENDLGDAPDSSNNFGAVMTAYPWGIVANYPTVYLTGSPPFGPIHLQPKAVAWLGGGVTLENEADLLPDQDGITNIDPVANSPNHDVNDDGVLGIPLLLPYCYPTTFKYRVNVVTNTLNLYVNVWFDWNRDGDWDDIILTCPNSVAPEWAVQNQLLAAGSLSVGLNTITTPQFRSWHNKGPSDTNNIWMRITLSEQPWVSGGAYVGDGGSGPATGYLYGETEDYNFAPVIECLKATAPEYSEWVQWNKPSCWCCCRQCRGDFDCKKAGPYWVSASDLNLLKLCFNKSDTQIKGMTNCICADCDHKKAGPYRIQANDLNCLKAYFNKPQTSVPCCDTNGDGILDCNLTGDKWNFWTN